MSDKKDPSNCMTLMCKKTETVEIKVRLPHMAIGDTASDDSVSDDSASDDAASDDSVSDDSASNSYIQPTPYVAAEVWYYLPEFVQDILIDYGHILCTYCSTLQNCEFDRKNYLKSAFCSGCIYQLSLTPRFLCGCGKTRYINAAGKPSPMCSTCYHNQKCK